MGLWLSVCLACQTLPYAPETVETQSNLSHTFQDGSKRSQTFLNSLSMFMLIYHTISYHTIPDGIMLASLPSLLNAPHTLPKRLKRIQTFLQRFRTLHNAPKCSQTLFVLMLTYIPCHTIPYHTIWDYAYHTTIHTTKTYIWNRPGNLYQVLHVFQFQTSSFSRCVCVSCKKHVGNIICICQLRLEKCKIRSLAHSRF